jgi:hypothetical protein
MLGLYSHQFRDKVFTDHYEGRKFAAMTDAQLANLEITKVDEIEAAQFGKYGENLRLLQRVEKNLWKIVNGVRRERLNRRLDGTLNRVMS